MRSIRTLTILLGLPLVFLAVAATRANAQAIDTASFRGTFTLPFTAQWGLMTLPAGEYNLYYGDINHAGVCLVEVAGKDNSGPRGLALARGGDTLANTENSLVCIREGNIGYVRELRMGAIGKSVNFALPHGAIVRTTIVSKKANANDKAKVAKVETVRLPVRVKTK